MQNTSKKLSATNKRTLFNQALKDIYNGNSTEVNQTIFDVYNKNYHDAITAVYGTKQNEKAKLFRINLSKLAACKTFWVTAELQQVRMNPDGSVKTWEEYQKEAKQIINKYNRYQQAEYDTFVARARTAKQFDKFLQKQSIFPNIKWLQTVSANPRIEHLALVGLILPIEHPFWLTNQPGNLYECKCDWINTDEPVTEAPELTDKPAKGLEGNPAITGEIVSDKHPYYNIIKDKFRHIPDWGVLMQPDEIVYLKHNIGRKNIFEHFLVNHSEESQTNMSIATILTENGYNNIRLLPQIHFSETTLRKRYFGNKYATSTGNPDAVINNMIVEFKTATQRNLSRRILEASRKSDVIVIVSKDLLSEAFIDRFIKGQFHAADRANITEIILINADNKVYKKLKRDY